MVQLIERFLFPSKRLLQLDEQGTVDSVTPNDKKIVTLLIPGTDFQTGKRKTFNVDCRGTRLYTDYNY